MTPPKINDAPPCDGTRLDDLIDVTRALSELVARENALLASDRPGAIAPLQAEKARLAAAYASAIRDVARAPEAVNGARAGLVEELKTMTRDFEARASQQRALLAGAKAAGEGLVRAIAREADRETSSRYAGESGAAAPVSVSETA